MFKTLKATHLASLISMHIEMAYKLPGDPRNGERIRAAYRSLTELLNLNLPIDCISVQVATRNAIYLTSVRESLKSADDVQLLDDMHDYFTEKSKERR